MTTEPIDWTALSAQVLSGDPDAQELFAREVGGWLHQMMAKWLPEGEDAEQMALDVLTEIASKLGRFAEERGYFWGWVRCIASRRVADYYRSRERRETDLIGQREREHRRKFHLREKPDDAARQSMIDAITRLKPEDMELLRLFFEEKHSDSEVAQMMGLTPANARQRKRRLVANLFKTFNNRETK